VWVRPDPVNAERLVAALRAFGAPIHDIAEADFAEPGITFQIGVAPLRIDIITEIDGLTFEPAWQNRVATEYGSEPVFVISREDFLKNTRASGRPQDLADIEALLRRK
jgi:hypothetical protein